LGSGSAADMHRWHSFAHRSSDDLTSDQLRRPTFASAKLTWECFARSFPPNEFSQFLLGSFNYSFVADLFSCQLLLDFNYFRHPGNTCVIIARGKKLNLTII
jgi:hypothetical protein